MSAPESPVHKEDDQRHRLECGKNEPENENKEACDAGVAGAGDGAGDATTATVIPADVIRLLRVI